METETHGATTQASSPWPARTGVSRTELDPTSFLQRSAMIHPDRVAVVDGELRRTYRELRDRVNRLASALRAQGLEHHERVAALCPNVPEMLELHHAVPCAGGVLVAINSRLSAAEVGYILEHSGARRLFLDPELEPLAAGAPAGLEVVRLGGEYERLVAAGDPAGVPSLVRDEEEPIAIDYTSGTTGRPKGVVYTYRGAYLNALGEVIEGELGHHPVYPVDAADVPLQRLVLPVGGDGGGGHARVPAAGRRGADLAAVPRGGRDPLLRLADRPDGDRQPPGRRPARAARSRRWSPPRRRRRRCSRAWRRSTSAIVHVYGLTETYGPHTVPHPAGRLAGPAGARPRAAARPPGPGLHDRGPRPRGR